VKLFVVYVVVFAIGTYCVYARTNETTTTAGKWRAARNLAAADQIKRDDLQRPDSPAERLDLIPIDSVIGKHITRAVSKGEAIGREDIASMPPLAAPTGESLTVIIALSASELPLTEQLHRGSGILFCRATKSEPPSAGTCLTPVLVVDGVHRDSGPSSLIGWVAARVAIADLPSLIPYLDNEQRAIVVAFVQPRS
jgi:hypothetical protein